MKNFILIIAIALLNSISSYAQEKGKITIHKNVNGEETVFEKEFDSTEDIDVEELLKEYGLDINIDVDMEEGARILEIIVAEESDNEAPFRFKAGYESGSRAFLGVTSGGSSEGKGAMVGRVIEGGSAEHMGLKEGDIITQFDGEKIFNFSMLREAVREARAGENVSLKIERDGKRKNIKGTIGEKQDDDIHSFFFDNGEHEYYNEFDSEKLENMLEELEIELENLDGQNFHFEWDGEDMEEWSKEFSEKMQAWGEAFGNSFEFDNNNSTRTVVIIVEDISKEEADAVNAQADPKLSTVNDLDLGELRFYPNPGDGQFDLSFTSNQSGDLNLMIFDSYGKKVYYEMLGDFEGRYENEIDISRRTAGSYFLQIEQGGKTYSKKIVKE